MSSAVRSAWWARTWARTWAWTRARTGAWSAEGLDALYPPSCWVCGAWAIDAFACDEHRLTRSNRSPPTGLAGPPRFERARCARCALRLPRGVPAGERCVECRRVPPAFVHTFVCGDWGPGPLREWVLAFKHGGRRELARPLAGALRAVLGERAAEFDVVVPVPLHPLRRLSRGYDQAQRLASEFAELADLRVARCLVRIRRTPPQGAPGAVSRAANVRAAFRLRRFAARSVSGRRVLLVDDVVTSGATVRECAAVLARAGAAEVAVAALARAGDRAHAFDGSDLDPPPE
ncbi:MAG: ComF family protein [Planctomycetes bacterium]|nr:ComF family protein [Planctomycetota bacterium]